MSEKTMKKLRRKFWGTFVKNSKYENSKEFENFIDEFVEIFELVVGENYNVVLLQSAENSDKIILTSKEYFSENKIDLLNEIIETFGTTTTSKGIEPMYELVSIEEI